MFRHVAGCRVAVIEGRRETVFGSKAVVHRNNHAPRQRWPAADRGRQSSRAAQYPAAAVKVDQGGLRTRSRRGVNPDARAAGYSAISDLGDLLRGTGKARPRRGTPCEQDRPASSRSRPRPTSSHFRETPARLRIEPPLVGLRGRCVGRIKAGGITDASEQVLAEKGERVAFLGVPQRRAPNAPSLCLVKPGNGVVLAHLAPLVGGLVDCHQDVGPRARIGLEVIPLLEPRPSLRQLFGGGVVADLAVDSRLLGLRMSRELHTADQGNVPRPFVQCRDALMHGGKPAAAPDEALKRRLLFVVENFARTIEEDDGAVAARFSGVKRAASSVASTAKPPSVASSRTAARPDAIES